MFQVTDALKKFWHLLRYGRAAAGLSPDKWDIVNETEETMAAKKILLVDDSKTALMMGRAILEKRTSYQCVTANDGLEAVTKASEEHPDLVLMDVVMPRMNGFEACKKMREQDATREVPIVLLTTRGEEEYMEAGFQSGCNDYLTKPVNGEELVKLLHSYLGE